MWKIVIFSVVMLCAMPLYAQGEYDIQITCTEMALYDDDDCLRADYKYAQKECESFFIECINAKTYAATIRDSESRDVLRKKWREWLGTDIYVPYYKMKEMEKWVREKCSWRLKGLKGRPEFDNDGIQYNFKWKF